MRARAPAPPTVWVFGIFSIVPLFIAAWVYCYGPLNLRGAGLLGLLGYATALLSFLGGVRCGLEFARRLPRWRIIGASLIAPFFAFFILLGAGSGRFDTVWQVSGLLLAFLLQWVWDVNDHEGPEWRPRLRTLLTAGAAVPLAFALEQALSL
ncbi:MAG TPA: DUF3429 domain-containing protein [Caulobacteraceae bacterium]|nr:DUF3429 domain-containing protein [Caulobacteraceae bacterium]